MWGGGGWGSFIYYWIEYVNGLLCSSFYLKHITIFIYNCSYDDRMMGFSHPDDNEKFISGKFRLFLLYFQEAYDLLVDFFMAILSRNYVFVMNEYPPATHQFGTNQFEY